MKIFGDHRKKNVTIFVNHNDKICHSGNFVQPTTKLWPSLQKAPLFCSRIRLLFTERVTNVVVHTNV